MTSPPDIIHATPDGRWSSRLAERSRTSSHAYRLIVAAERSAASHRQYMAAVSEAWANLPERLVGHFPSPDHLRRWALIKTGYCHIEKIVGNRRRVAVNGYSVITVEDGVTTVYTAKSQSYTAMGKDEFQKSKDAVLDYLAKLIETTTDELKKAAQSHAA
jgi:hypothetical protein